MNEIDLWHDIDHWIKKFHWFSLYRTGLLGDFRNDLWIRLKDRQVNRQYIKKACYYYPFEVLRTKYYKKTRDWVSREVVYINEEGDYREFGSPCFEYELPTLRKKIVRTKRLLPLEIIEEIKLMRSSGKTLAYISQHFKVSESTVHRLCNSKPKTRQVEVLYLNGEVSVFPNMRNCSEVLGVKVQSVHYKMNNKPMKRASPTTRKLSHVKSIRYV